MQQRLGLGVVALSTVGVIATNACSRHGNPAHRDAVMRGPPASAAPAGAIASPAPGRIALASCEPDDGGRCYAFLGDPDPAITSFATARMVRPVVATLFDRHGATCRISMTSALLDGAGATAAFVGNGRADCGPIMLVPIVLDGSEPVSAELVEIEATDPDLELSYRGASSDVAVAHGPQIEGITSVEVKWAGTRTTAKVEGYVFRVYVVRDGVRARVALLVRKRGFETSTDERGVAVKVIERP